ncbi:HNH endonuclease [Myroides odoratimimus]|nr:HNH endonuclease signature motif containing protein [Myroides odoratimimus]
MTDNFCVPFPKESYFKSFIVFIIDYIVFEDLENIDVKNVLSQNKKLWIEFAFDDYGLPYTSFQNWVKEQEIEKDSEHVLDDSLYRYFEELFFYGSYQELLDKMSDEIFFILFNNLDVLFKFNYVISNSINFSKIQYHEVENQGYFKKDGVLKRKTIPKWVRKSVFFRDRGKCRCCNKDLSGLLSLDNTENFDHIIPLYEGGINDVTNIQLLCEICNKKKGKKVIKYNYKYEKWF